MTREEIIQAVKDKKSFLGFDLSGAGLRDAILRDADLRGADLSGAILSNADLRDADLSGADLSGADLSNADLRDADLSGADLRGAILLDADLRDADLRDADLRDADLRDADLREVIGLLSIIPEEGSFIAFKKLANGTTAKLLIPKDAKRVSSLTGRKCRASKAIVLEGEGYSSHAVEFSYAVGRTVIPDRFDSDRRVECSHGIHFFLTRKEAEEY